MLPSSSRPKVLNLPSAGCNPFVTVLLLWMTMEMFDRWPLWKGYLTSRLRTTAWLESAVMATCRRGWNVVSAGQGFTPTIPGKGKGRWTTQRSRPVWATVQDCFKNPLPLVKKGKKRERLSGPWGSKWIWICFLLDGRLKLGPDPRQASNSSVDLPA